MNHNTLNDRFPDNSANWVKIQTVADLIVAGNDVNAENYLQENYPFTPVRRDLRSYTIEEKFSQFQKDSFIDRYSGDRLVHPGMLKVLSVLFPDCFPYQEHWKMTETHSAYWTLFPTIDHIVPIARGGKDIPENRVTTSMIHNSAKSNWTLEELGWKLYPKEHGNSWDGLTTQFLRIVKTRSDLLQDRYIAQWYQASKK